MAAFTVAWDTTVAYLKKSSIAGLCHAANARSVVRAFYWLVIFSLGLGMTGRGIVVLVDEFMRYPVITSSHLTTKPYVTFPAVTLCNINRLNCQAVLRFNYDLLTKIREDDFASAAERTEASDLFAELSDLSVRTGCRSQACSVMAYDMAGERYNNASDPIVLNLHQLGCWDPDILEDTSFHVKVCYYLYTIVHYDQYATDEYRAVANRTMSEIDCTKEVACKYVESGEYHVYVDDEDYPEPGEMIVDDCSEESSEEDRRRKKRGARGEDDGGEGGEDDEEEEEETEEAKLERRRKARIRREAEEQTQILDESAFMKRYMKLSEGLRVKLGHQFDWASANNGKPDWMTATPGMFVKCFYQGRDCFNSSMWYPSLTPNFGNCYTFNTMQNPQDVESPRTATLTGATNGLSVEMYLDQINYMRGELSQRAGVRLIAHSPDSFPMADEFGLDIMPGTYSSVSIQMNEITRLPEPHPSDCVDSWNQTTLDQTLMTPKRPKYASAVCTRFCLQHLIMQSCDCFHTQLEMSLMDVDKFNYKDERRPCDIGFDGRGQNDFVCVKDILSSYDQRTTCPSCHPACNETEYGASVTTSLWPSNRYWTDLAMDLDFDEEEVFDTANNQAIQERIQQNYLKVDVYFQTLNVREVEQKKKYTADSAFAALGGGLSLYLGVAIILVFEIFELCYDVFVAVWKHGSKKTSRWD